MALQKIILFVFCLFFFSFLFLFYFVAILPLILFLSGMLSNLQNQTTNGIRILCTHTHTHNTMWIRDWKLRIVLPELDYVKEWGEPLEFQVAIQFPIRTATKLLDSRRSRRNSSSWFFCHREFTISSFFLLYYILRQTVIDAPQTFPERQSIRANCRQLQHNYRRSQ